VLSVELVISGKLIIENFNRYKFTKEASIQG